MLLRRAVLERIVSGEVEFVFRRWRRPTVRSGGSLRTPASSPGRWPSGWDTSATG